MSWFELSDDDQQDAIVTLLVAYEHRSPTKEEAEKVLDRPLDDLEWSAIEEQLNEELDLHSRWS